MTEPVAAKPTPSEPQQKDAWFDCLPSRRETGEIFTRIVTSDTEAKVITVEAGFGQGKSVFMNAWAEHLNQQGEAVIKFDAWKSDHSDDPLMAFTGALIAKMPHDLTEEMLEKVRAGAKNLGGILAKGVASWVLREAAEDLTDWVSGLSDDEELSKTLTTLSGDATGKVSSATEKMLVAQIVKEHARLNQLPVQLEALRDALQVDKKDPKGRVIVMIDELDRCRPDYAIGLLEAIKHLFEVKGFIFVLMVNNDQIERTAAHLYGEAKNAEPYLSKFVDYRLNLPLDGNDRVNFAKWRSGQITFTPVNDAEHFSRESFIETAGELAGSSNFSLRQLDRIFLNVDVALKCLAVGETADASLLAYYSFDRASKLYLSCNFNPTPKISFLNIDLKILRELIGKWTIVTTDRHVESMRAFRNYFNQPRQGSGWDDSILKPIVSDIEGWETRHRQLIEGAVEIIVHE